YTGIEVFGDMLSFVMALEKKNGIITMPFKKAPKHVEKLAANISINCVASPVFNGRMDHYGTELKRLLKEGYEIHVTCGTEERKKSLAEYANRAEIEGEISYQEGFIPEGMYFPDDKIAYISDSNIFKTVKKKRKKKASKGRQIKAFTELNPGDYVVHENHGIGRFIGIEPLVVEGIRRDYMTIKYADKDMLYVPVEQMDLVQTYIGSGGAAPKVNKLSSGDWKKTKARAKAAIAGMAEELVRLSAERTMEFGYSFGPDTPWQRQFEDMFPYQETENQLRCIDEIKTDMEMPWPMDRLLCGDVGFGKTEVAARAVFKCIMDGKQAAVLVPTTILASQHYHTFKERFENFPCTVDLMCRFRSEAQQNQTIDGVKNGSVDVLIGTHRILSKDVKFKDLGLLVIDEEQRFGVQHKEAIKYLKKNVDVLTLSATPIPRTLHMSLSGIRSMSTLEEPPEDRYPVQTYVLEQDDILVREIIMRELDRGGQVFVVFNRVKGINQIADGLRQLVPDARVAVAHGQMAEGKLEDIMVAFTEHEYDVLVATTIIESGIDVPNANTLIILDADNFGLAQLYQLKGRVGRSNRAAYAYFMYKKDKVLSEIAVKRLRAIKEFTEFGSGFRIAMKDLELRGAGNLLGTEQSGHMMQIGYELYCKLIDEAVRKLRGQKVTDTEMEVSIEIKVDAYISSDYIKDEALKLDMYKRISEIKSVGDMSDVTDELIDRFGDIPAETESLMQVALIQAGCRLAGIKRVAMVDGKVLFEFVPDNNGLTAEILSKLSEVYGMKLIINLGKKPFIRMPAGNRRQMLADIVDFLSVFTDEHVVK
ncbi:MAG: transcription-repair coupling factor, partial [Firmicutes bacterium]|nr:transcription-repair coupling factor [Bacillota bacterium]